MKIVLNGDPEPYEVTEKMLESEVLPRLLTFSTTMFAADDPQQPQADFCGSGVFVLAGGPALLTAAHVWERVRRYDFLLLTLHSAWHGSASHPLVVPREGVIPRYVSKRVSDKWGEWGPDIALLSLFPAAEGSIKRSKAFYNLERRRASALASEVRHQDGLWAILGGVGEQSTFGPDETVIQTTIFASTIGGTAERNGHDYLELFINHEGKPSGYLPSSYGGISGSGLWRVDVRRSGSGGVVIADDGVSLEGLAFWEEPREGLHGFLRCHGRESIYGRMMDEMAAASSAS
jgi:hypothetical protein